MSQENHEEGLLLEEKKEIRQIIDELIVKIEEYTSTTSLINNVNLTKKIETRGRKKKLTNKIREKHQCSECEFSTAKRLSLKKHIILKHSDKIVEPFKCEFCDKVFKDPGQLNNHRNVHIGFKPFKCNKCKLNFTTKGELIRHTRYKHTLERPHKCTYCDYSSVELSKLKRHIRVHTGERPYLCPHCDYASRDTFKLKRHLRIHTGEKPYECPVCKHSFSQSNSLKMHMKKSHASISSKTSTINRSDIFSLQQIKATSELSTIKNLENQLNDLQEASNLDIVLIDNTTDMFECKVCCMKFLTNKLLNEHSVEHTGERLFECKICAVRFTHKFALRSHTLSHDVEYSESLKLKLKLINQTTEIANSQMQTGVRAIDENYDKPSRGIMNFQNEGKIGDQQRCKLIETQSEDLAKKDESIKINDGVAKSNQDEANKSDNKINQFPEENFKFKVGQNKRKIHNSENSFVVINNSRKHQLDSTLIKNTNENSSMNNKCKFCFKNYASACN